jgi:hypothetical protein
MPIYFRRGRCLILSLILLVVAARPARCAINVLFVTTNNGSLTALESGRKAMLESFGFTVNTIWDGASQATFNAAFANNRAVYLPDEATAADVSYKLRETTIGIFSEHPGLADELGFCSAATTTAASSTINIGNNTHYITNTFPTGNLTLGSGTYTIIRMAGTTAPGGQVLANIGGVDSIVAVDTGGTLATSYNSSTTAFGRRAEFPLPVSVNDGSTFNTNVFTLAGRMLSWCCSLDRTLVGHWKLNESSGTAAADSSGLSTSGAVTGTTSWTSAVMNNGFQFNGSTKIQVAGMFSNPKNVSVTAWANLTTADTAGAEIISLGDHFFLRLDEGGVAKASIWNGTAYQNVTYAGVFAGTGWHHFAATFDDDNNTFKLYIDGVQVTSVSNTSSINYTGLGANTVIGRQGNNGTSNDFTGTIDDVRVYNYAISATEVAEIYGLIGRWKLNETTGTTAADSTVLAHNGAVAGASNWTTDCGGMAAFNFDGSTNYVSVGNDSHLQPTDMLAVSAWVYGTSWRNSSGGDVNTIVRKGEGVPNKYSFNISSGKVQLCLDDTDAAGFKGNTVLNTNQWYHVAATWDGTTARIYVNGVLDNAPGSAKAAPIGVDTRTLYIGGRAGTDCFTGMIRDVRLYNRPLTSNEILQGAGLVGHWKFAEGSESSSADSSTLANHVTLSGGADWTSDCTGNNNALLTTTSGGIATTQAPFDPPETGTVAMWIRSNGAPSGNYRIFAVTSDYEIRQISNGSVIADLCGDGATTIGTVTPIATAGTWYHFAATYDSTTKAYAIYVNGQLEKTGAYATMTKQRATAANFGTRAGSGEYFGGALRDVRVYNRKLCPQEIEELYGLVGHWKFNETSGTTAADSSGMGRDGIVVGTPTWVAGKINNAIQFNGSNRVDVNSLMGSPRNVTMAGWAFLTANDSGGAELISIGNYFAIRLNEGITAKALFYNGTTWLSAGFSKNYIGLGWHHFAAVFNDDQDLLTFYVDGIEQANLSTTASIAYSGQGTKTVIGAHGNGQTTYDFTGKVDDMRIFNRALCPSEVQELKNAGGSFSGVKITKWIEIQ